MTCPKCGAATRIYSVTESLEGAFVRRKRICKRSGCWLKFATREEPEPGDYDTPSSDEDVVAEDEVPLISATLRAAVLRAVPLALGQDGYFTAADAREVGCRRVNLQYFLSRGAIVRLSRGIYRLAFVPPHRNEQVIVAWLWSERAGVVSHQTALELHDLLPREERPVHLTVPTTWCPRIRRLPRRIVLHRSDSMELGEVGALGVPTTDVARAIVGSVVEGASVAALRAAIREATRRQILDLGVLEAEAARSRVDLRHVAPYTNVQRG